MNHHRVPDFEMEEDYLIPASTGPAASKSEMVVNHSIPPAGPSARKSIWLDEEIMELQWHNGQVVMQSQSQRRPTPPAAPSQPENQQSYQEPHLFIQEDEMVSWLQYPLPEDDPFGSDLLYTGSNSVQSANPPPRRSELQNFLHFSRFNDHTTNSSRFVPPSSPAKKSGVVREMATVVESNTNNNASEGRGLTASYGGSGAAVASGGREAMTTCEMSLTSSTGVSIGGGSQSAELMSPTQKPLPLPPPRTAEDRKRKGREAEDTECQSQDADFESANAKKRTPRGLGSTKRSRAAEVHNLSERRRRDRINEKMRVLQELIPRCNKSDKASMLDEAIEYLKSLQLQIQMMSMGCGMVPMMFPGVQQYMPMGMGMGMGMNQPMMPFPNILPGSTMPSASAAPHMGPRFPIPPLQMQTMLPNDPNRVQAPNQSEHMSNSPGTPNQNQPQGQNFADPYQPYLTPQQLQMQMQMQLQQSQALGQPSSSKASRSMGPDNQESHE